MKTNIIIVSATSLLLLVAFMNKNDTSTNQLLIVKKESIIKESIIKESEPILISKNIIKKEIKSIQKNITAKKEIVITKKEVKTNSNKNLVNIALKDLEMAHSSNQNTPEAHHILEQKAEILAQILKIKFYYEEHITDFNEAEYEKVYSRIDKANAAYDDLLYVSVDTLKFSDFFREYNKILHTL